MSKPKRFVYKNGGELFYQQCKASNATNIEAGIKVGHYDNGDNDGLAHFFEHMLFKGTEKRPLKELKDEIQTISGINAYTGEKLIAVVFYDSNKTLEKNMEIIGDMWFNSIFPEDEIEKEKGVIEQEYYMWFDKPEIFVEEQMQSLLMGDPKNIKGTKSALGEPDKIKTYKREDFLKFKEKYVCSNNFFVAASGPLPFGKFKKLCDKYFFSKLEKNPGLKVFDEKKMQIKGKPQLFIQQRNINKVSAIIEIKNDINRTFKNQVICNCLNGIINGWNGEIFNQMRDKNGLVYIARVGDQLLMKNGTFGCFFETTKEKLNKCFDTLANVFKGYLQKGFSEKELSDVKEKMLLDEDRNVEHPRKLSRRGMSQFLKYDRFISEKERVETLKSITLDDINNMLKRIFKGNDVYVCIVGNAEQEGTYSYNKIRKIFDLRKFAN